MDKGQIMKLITICSANYRNWPEKGKEEATVLLWQTMLEGESYEITAYAVKKHIGESVYPPTIADIRARIAELTVVQGKTGIEAWGDVKAAIRRFGSYNEEKAMQSLTGPTRKVVESIGFKTLCMSENEMADRAHFLKVYETVDKREREEAVMMPSLKAARDRFQAKALLE